MDWGIYQDVPPECELGLQTYDAYDCDTFDPWPVEDDTRMVAACADSAGYTAYCNSTGSDDPLDVWRYHELYDPCVD